MTCPAEFLAAPCINLLDVGDEFLLQKNHATLPGAVRLDNPWRRSPPRRTTTCYCTSNLVRSRCHARVALASDSRDFGRGGLRFLVEFWSSSVDGL